MNLDLPYAIFFAVLILPLAVIGASLASQWMRRASVALVVPWIVGSVAWCLAVLPNAQASAGLQPDEALSVLALAGVAIVTVCGTVAAGTWLKLRGDFRWPTLLASGLLFLALDAVMLVRTAGAHATWLLHNL